jgi:plastocyanin
MLGAAEEDDENGNDDDENGSEDHFIADLVDPVFGYPLASSETDDVELENVVDLMVEEGGGSHEEFPLQPAEDGSGQSEVPAEFFFDPVGLHVKPDALVHFNVVNHLHTVTAFHEKFHEPNLDMPTRIPAGVPGFTSPPVTPDESWIYQFTTKGVYDYLCLPHLGLGMVGRIVVFDPGEDDIEDDMFAAPSAGELPPNVDGVFSADELDPANIVEEGTVAWEDLTL